MEIEPLYRLTKASIEELLELHDAHPEMSLDELLEAFEDCADYSEYGT